MLTPPEFGFLVRAFTPRSDDLPKAFSLQLQKGGKRLMRESIQEWLGCRDHGAPAKIFCRPDLAFAATAYWYAAGCMGVGRAILEHPPHSFAIYANGQTLEEDDVERSISCLTPAACLRDVVDALCVYRTRLPRPALRLKHRGRSATGGNALAGGPSSGQRWSWRRHHGIPARTFCPRGQFRVSRQSGARPLASGPAGERRSKRWS